MFTPQIKSTLILLRFPFSLFLMPLFFWALTFVPHPDPWQTFALFVIFHGLVYPASNGYNSAIDQDTEAIGGLAQPPPPPGLLKPVTALMDVLALLWGCTLGLTLGLCIGFLILMSRLYSAPWPRLKQYPYTSFFLVSILQGAFTFGCLRYGLEPTPPGFQALVTTPAGSFDFRFFGAALVSSLLVGSAYLLSQVFQHEADAERGDLTLSRVLRPTGTFYASECFLGLAFYCFYVSQPLEDTFVFLLCMFPAWAYLIFWHLKVIKDAKQASFKHSFRLNILWALGLNLCFLLLLYKT